MKQGDIIHGFEFTRVRDIPELEARLWEATYIKNGAELIFIDRKDTNKSFAITFKTIPSNDTGVFHILEHSVLCGSDKYPVKEPFVELLKGSLKTFLNACTFPDKTMYPVASRNDKDFLNLVDIYMDAVLHPIATRKPEIFYQEGWHHELHSKDEDMLYKGVVFNEMKGAYSSADEVEMREMCSLLYKGSCYEYDSGGDPLAIPQLTYEEFVAAHAKFYHPSNSKIVLDGSVDIEKTLALLDSYLSEYDYLEIDASIPFIENRGHIEKTIRYEISETESPDGKARICLGFKAADFNERKKNIALGVLLDAIAGSNDAPFKKAMLDLGICEDVALIALDSVQENSVLLEIKNVKESNLAAARAAIFSTLEKIAREGIDKKALTAAFNILEFRLREQDTAGSPAGINYAMAVFETWLYGGDPLAALAFDDDLAYLREKLDTDYYEQLITDVFLNSPHSATLYMLPSATLGEERLMKERQTLAEKKALLNEEELLEIIRATERLETWQKTPDSEEALATIPSLSLSDISELPEKYPIEEYTVSGRPALFTKVASRGIVYTRLIFDIRDFSEEEICLASLLTELYKNLSTENYCAVDLQTKIKTELGSFATNVLAISSKEGTPVPYFLVSASALLSRLNEVPEICEEVLLKTLFKDKAAIKKIVRQLKVTIAESITASGHSVAFSRCSAYTNRVAALCEYIDGIENYFWIKKLDEGFDDEGEALLAKLTETAKKIFSKNRLTVFTAGSELDTRYTETLATIFPDGSAACGECKIGALGVRNEGFIIPAQIAFASQAADIRCEARVHGSFTVIRSLLSYGYLWNEIRVQGGAYGAGFIKRKTGMGGFYTYRDPNAARSLDCFAGCSDFLRDMANSGTDITNFIIGAIGDSDPIITPKLLGALAFLSYLNGETFEDRVKERAEMLATSKEDLLRAADILDRAFVGGYCVIGGKDKLEACGAKLDMLIEI